MTHSKEVQQVEIDSPSNITHVIIHNLNVTTPMLAILDTVNNQLIVADSILVDSPNQITINFVVPKTIKVKVVKNK